MRYILLFTLFASTLLNGQDPVNTIDRYIESTYQDWDIPGVAIAIVKDGKQVLSKGYGVRDVNSKEPVDANTLFAIASNTQRPLLLPP